MQDTFDKPPLRVEHQPSMGPPLLSLTQRVPGFAARQDMPAWAVSIQLRLDTIIRQQDLILDRLDHPWRYRWRRVVAGWYRFLDRLTGV